MAEHQKTRSRFKLPIKTTVTKKSLSKKNGDATQADAENTDSGKAPPRLTQAQRRELAERRILDAALEIVARRGSVRMTLAEVGEAAGYSRGLPAHRFGNKEGLLRELANTIGERFEARFRALPVRQPGLDALRWQVTAYFDRDDKRWIETRALLVMMTEGFMEDSSLNPHIREYLHASIDRLAEHIRKGIALGEIRPEIDPVAAATLILGAMRGVLHQRLVFGDLELASMRDITMQMVDRTLSVDYNQTGRDQRYDAR